MPIPWLIPFCRGLVLHGAETLLRLPTNSSLADGTVGTTPDDGTGFTAAQAAAYDHYPKEASEDLKHHRRKYLVC